MSYTALAAALAAAAAFAGTATGAAAPQEPETRLVISVSENGELSDARETTLTCNPAGGEHSAPQAACDELDAAGAAVLSPVSRTSVCTQMYGGPETARVTGVWAGQPVDAEFSRTNGCEMHRWDQLGTVLGR
ncbi:SSI family serine proteinase inhibitor [Streptomyces spiramenti]|uniref:Subtilisin inhibitor domain-containing protein n=1 Tax=Streptomyces spiramenti TaxID=2720606 RepID=A0ABX1AMP7_9ACTN|nr:SSI family serine proteinase inhibitor [Streptomyces spiramenti]NJP68379.1 hypothetical protein [Streptomyces spiramenti]